MEVHSVPVISTMHLTQSVAATLLDMGNKNEWCPCAAWEHGYFLSLDDLEAREGVIPQCLVDIRNWLVSKNLVCTHGGLSYRATWIRLDSAADHADDLPVYDW